jgi:hypothetical protein
MACSVGNPGLKGWGTLFILLCSCVAVPACDDRQGSSSNRQVMPVRTAASVMYLVQLNSQPAAQPSNQQHPAGWQQQVADASGPANSKGSSNTHNQQYAWHRRQLHKSGQQLPADGPERLEAWLQNTTWIRTYQNGSCFPSGRVHQAANIRGEVSHTKWHRHTCVLA